MRSKPRAVVFGSGFGIFQPLMLRFREEFEIVAVISVQTPRWLQYLLLPFTFRPRRADWYRNWVYHFEKTPWSFRLRTWLKGRRLRELGDAFDLVLFLGAMDSPGKRPDKPFYVFSDSTRALSSGNANDSVSWFKSDNERKKWLRLEGDVYRSARRIFVGSQYVRQSLLEHYAVPDRNVVVTGFGPGFAVERVEDKPFDGRTLLYIGKGDFEKKGGLILLEAFERVRRIIPDAHLDVVGQDSIPMQPGVRNHGFITDRDKLREMMRAAHAFVLPSLVDRNPISIIEAMAASTPCVSTDFGAIPEILGGGGLAVPCRNVEALAEALVRVLCDADFARELGRRGRLRYETCYRWDAIWARIRCEIHTSIETSGAA
jgi:glycosyltransferase involved in cell wall biosynthesis